MMEILYTSPAAVAGFPVLLGDALHPYEPVEVFPTHFHGSAVIFCSVYILLLAFAV